ncbi:M23 family metallopeptidase [Streptomyces aidingensis]|uniref:Murein DD-endopeptidase MepM and murein hydrolase activator NlpD, contain LysM domain n=1 Tax=Streptomyces aidingensis TaxID=910347 RepID=A0A1I1GLQ2_9ACTN|nr:M23 family metallopeptidase [Streptomyces aidingensis]SFC12534.1 Murein DD-endopeptidase MepM and murein hydrolase activator NlpD, contain LysM domain [Streptomyces aidingensis]
MPGRGRHRRPRNSRMSRISLMLTAGGAGVALPLVAAGTASAAPAPAAAQATAVTVPETAAGAHVAALLQQAAAAQQSADDRAGHHTVKTGDTLFKIAKAHDVDGGWLALYDVNQKVIGDNPNLIHPGQKLSLKTGSASGSGSAASGKAERTSDGGDSGDGGIVIELTEVPAAEAPAEQPAPPAEQPAPEQPAPEQPAAEAPAAEEPTAEQSAAASGYTAPVDAPITTAYRVTGAMWASGYHTGVDFNAGAGTSVKAVSSGTVVSAGWGGSYGNEVIIQHEDGHYSQYAHLSAISVSAGQSVTVGQEIGLVGTTGNSTGPHLHFEIRTGTSYGTDIDPVAYLRTNGVTV